MCRKTKNITGNKQSKVKRITLALCICFIVLFLLTEIFIITHVNHDCIGRDCQICKIIHSAAILFENIGVTFIGIFSFISILYDISSFFESQTLVYLKIRMNN